MTAGYESTVNGEVLRREPKREILGRRLQAARSNAMSPKLYEANDLRRWHNKPRLKRRLQ